MGSLTSCLFDAEAANPFRIALHRDLVSRMDQTVSGRIGKSGVPALHWKLTGDNDRMGLVAVINDLKDLPAVGRREGGDASFIENKEIYPGQRTHQLGTGAVDPGQGRIGQ